MSPLVLFLAACKTDCPVGSFLGDDGLCHLEAVPDDTAVLDSGSDTATDTADTADPVTWLTLPEGCQAPDDLPADPLVLDSTLFVQDEVVAELVEIEIDTERQLAIAGGSGGGSDRAGGVMLFDISGEAPEFLSADTPDDFMNRTYHVELGPDDVVYATHRDKGLAVTLTADRGRLSQAEAITGSDFSGMASDDTHLWLTTHAGELRTFDITTPDAPVELDRMSGLGNAWAPHRLGDRLYIADNTLGVGVVDISDPDSPSLVGYVEASGGVQDIAFSEDGSALYAAVGGAGVEVFDLTDPDEPVSLGLHNVHDAVISVAVDGHTLWAVNQQDVVAVDVSSPLEPVLLNTEPTEQWAMHVAAAGGRAYVADWGYLPVYAVDDSVAAPDLALGSDRVFLAPGGQIDVALSNLGAGTLSLVGATAEGVTATVSDDTLTSGAQGTLRLVAPDGDFTGATVCLASNDPDAPVQTLTVVGTTEGTGVGAEAPDFTLSDLDGVSHTLSDQRGRPVVLVYFATW